MRITLQARDGDEVTAKRIGWQGDNVTETDILDPYDYTDAETVVEGVLHIVTADGPFVDRHENYLVNGQVVDPDTIQPLTAVTSSGRPVPVIPPGLLNVRPRVQDELTAAAGDEPHTGSMIALVPEADDAARLALGGDHAETCEELHITLAYLGDAVDWSDDARALLLSWVQRAVTTATYDIPVIGDVFGVNLWNIHGDEPSVNLAVGGEDLQAFRDTVWSSVVTGLSEEEPGLTPGIPEQHTPWVPHICLGYANEEDLFDEFTSRAMDSGRFGPVAFDRVRVAFGSDVVDIPVTTEP